MDRDSSTRRRQGRGCPKRVLAEPRSAELRTEPAERRATRNAREAVDERRLGGQCTRKGRKSRQFHNQHR
eukprot:11175611-Lingulodinium_polyedra.AAC.1